jgi:NAD(P)-dependent dehydrogenase (short-subunit alcohol dehydrogenase family)
MVNAPQQRVHRNVVVTGASAGIGRAVALRFARAGARLGLMARGADALLDVKEVAERLGARAVIAPVDVADAAAVFSAADSIAADLGSIDIWINDAMVTVFSPVWEMAPEEFRRVTEVTYLGAVHGTMAALRHMRPRNSGAIVQVGSALAYRGIPLQAAYCGAKHALRGFTDSLRSELIHDRSAIDLTMVELPAVNTPQFDWARTHMAGKPRPVAPVVQPEAIAEQIFRAALRPKREYWLGISTLEAILGNMVLPEFFDRYLARKTVAAQQTRVPVPAGREDNLMAPVHGLHRTRGSFSDESASRVVAVSGPVARLAPLLAAALGGLTAGLVLGAASTPRIAPQPRRRWLRDLR